MIANTFPKLNLHLKRFIKNASSLFHEFKIEKALHILNQKLKTK